MADDALTFTGERLHAEDALFGIDLLRHRAAYQAALDHAYAVATPRILELGSGTGYGTAELAEALAARFGTADRGVVGVDRVAPLDVGRRSPAQFLRADLNALPLRGDDFDLVLSFQVIEHLPDPTRYVDALANHLREDGTSLVTTPNAAFSDGENPFHVREYEAQDLHDLLAARFHDVEMLGVSARGEALAYHEARLARIRRIVRIDPFGLRKRIPTKQAEWLFARLALVVRRGIGADERLTRATLADFWVEPAHERSVDLMAVCRRPRRDT